MIERLTSDEYEDAATLAHITGMWRHVQIVLEEGRRARASEEAKDAPIKALADALQKHARQVSCPACGGIGSRTCATCDHGETPIYHPDVVAALLKAGRLK